MSRPIETSNGLPASQAVSVKLDPATHKALRYLAVEQGKTVSALLREQAERLTQPTQH